MSSISICVKWSGKEYEVSELAATDTVETLKVRQHNKSKWCLFRWRLWKRLVWGRRGKSCWIWRWTIIQNTLSWCSMFRWKERLQLTAWSWGSSASSKTSSSWWWEGITWLSTVFDLQRWWLVWRRPLLRRKLSLRICQRCSMTLRRKRRLGTNPQL